MVLGAGLALQLQPFGGAVRLVDQLAAAASGSRCSARSRIAGAGRARAMCCRLRRARWGSWGAWRGGRRGLSACGDDGGGVADYRL